MIFFLDTRFAPGLILSGFRSDFTANVSSSLRTSTPVDAAGCIKLNISEFSRSVTPCSRGVFDREIISLHLILLSQTISINLLQLCSQKQLQFWCDNWRQGSPPSPHPSSSPSPPPPGQGKFLQDFLVAGMGRGWWVVCQPGREEAGPRCERVQLGLRHPGGGFRQWAPRSGGVVDEAQVTWGGHPQVAKAWPWNVRTPQVSEGNAGCRVPGTWPAPGELPPAPRDHRRRGVSPWSPGEPHQGAGGATPLPRKPCRLAGVSACRERGSRGLQGKSIWGRSTASCEVF